MTTMIGRDPASTSLALEFVGESHDALANVLRGMKGWVVECYPIEGEPFDATIGHLFVKDEDGQWKVSLARFNEEAGTGDPNDIVELDIYDDIKRLVVI